MRITCASKFIYLLAAGFCTNLTSVGANAQDPGNPKANDAVMGEIRFIAAGVKDARESLKCAEATLTYHEKVPKESTSSQKERETTFEVNWHIQDEKLAVRIETFSGNSKTPTQTHTFVSDGRQAKILSLEGGHLSGLIIPAEEVLKDGMWERYLYLDPRYVFYHDGQPLDFLLTKLVRFITEDAYKANVRQVKLDGRPYTQIEILAPDGKTKRLYQVDVEHGFKIHSAEKYLFFNNKMNLLKQKNLSLSVESADSPSTIEINEKIFEGVFDEKVDVPPLVRHVKISQFRVGCDIAPDVFKLDWPVGTEVTNAFDNTTFVVQPPAVKEEKPASSEKKVK